MRIPQNQSTCSHQQQPSRRISRLGATRQEQPDVNLPEPLAEVAKIVGEDAAMFSLQDQSISAWGIFTILLLAVLGVLYAVSGTDFSRIMHAGCNF